MRRKQIVVLTLALLMVVSLLSGCLGVGTYEISGRVADSNGNGVGGVRLMITGGTTATVVTAADGKWKATVKGTVTVVPEPQDGFLFSPPERTGIQKSTGSNLNFERVSNKILWYVCEDSAHDAGSFAVVYPPEDLVDSKYDIVVEENLLTEVPGGYDVLVLSDTGATFDVSEFTGRIIVTIDGGVSPLLYWLTGNNQEEVLWSFDSESELDWIKPITGREVGTSGDAFIYTSLESELTGFTRRNDLIHATSYEAALEEYPALPEGDDIILYEIDNEMGSWWWLHIGPHFGKYEEEIYVPRTWEIIHYALDLINGYEPSFPPIPVVEAGSMSLTVAGERN